jgi:hypothetical protein
VLSGMLRTAGASDGSAITDDRVGMGLTRLFSCYTYSPCTLKTTSCFPPSSGSSTV